MYIIQLLKKNYEKFTLLTLVTKQDPSKIEQESIPKANMELIEEYSKSERTVVFEIRKMDFDNLCSLVVVEWLKKKESANVIKPIQAERELYELLFERRVKLFDALEDSDRATG